MRKIYQEMLIEIEFFQEEDIVTASPSGYDGTGEIPDWWYV